MSFIILSLVSGKRMIIIGTSNYADPKMKLRFNEQLRRSVFLFLLVAQTWSMSKSGYESWANLLFLLQMRYVATRRVRRLGKWPWNLYFPLSCLVFLLAPTEIGMVVVEAKGHPMEMTEIGSDVTIVENLGTAKSGAGYLIAILFVHVVDLLAFMVAVEGELAYIL